MSIALERFPAQSLTIGASQAERHGLVLAGLLVLLVIRAIAGS